MQQERWYYKELFIKQDRQKRWGKFQLHLVSIGKFQVFFAAYPTVEWHSRVCKPGLGVIRLTVQDEGCVNAPEQRKAHGEADDSDEDPVVSQPEDELDVIAMPAVAQVVGEEAPRVVVVLIRKENA
jgi:hypothetical protein